MLHAHISVDKLRSSEWHKKLFSLSALGAYISERVQEDNAARFKVAFHCHFHTFLSARTIFYLTNRMWFIVVTGSNPVEALICLRLLLSNCLSWKINCDDHPSLSSTTAVQI